MKLKPRNGCYPTATLCLLASAACARGDVLVCDWETNTVRRFADDGTYLGDWISDPELKRPGGIAIDAGRGVAYVTSWWYGAVFRYDLRTAESLGALVYEFVLPETGLAMSPQDIHLGADGLLYVQTDSQNGGVVRFDPETGEYLGRFIDTISQVGFFHYVTGMDVGPGGDFYLGQRDAGDVWRFDGETGRLIAQAGWAFKAGSVAAAPDGALYVSDWSLGKVNVFAPGPVLRGSLPVEILGAWGVDVAPDGTVYASGFRHPFLEVFDATGGHIRSLPIPGASEVMNVEWVDPADLVDCRADLDGDGQLTFFDFLAFQNLFAAGDLRADFDGSGALDFFDFLAFQNEFAAGCA
jgi:sugar lactone lactonase YvrE